jgi:hypothetical protein
MRKLRLLRTAVIVLLIAMVAYQCVGTDEPTSNAGAPSEGIESPQSEAPQPTGGAPTSTPAASKVTAEELSRGLVASRASGAAVVFGSVAYLIGGTDDKLRATNSIVRFDTENSATKKVGDGLDGPLYDAAGVNLTDSALVIGGTRGNVAVTAVFQVNTDGVAKQIANLPSPRSHASAVFSNNVLYLVGGSDEANPTNDVLSSTDGGVTWSKVGTLTQNTMFPAVFVQGTTLWVVGGEWGNKAIKTIQQMNLSDGTVSLPPQLNTARSRACTLTIGSTQLIVGGRTPSGLSDEVLGFNAGSVNLLGTLPAKVSDHDCVTVGDNGYVLGGQSPKPTTRVIELVPATASG